MSEQFDIKRASMEQVDEICALMQRVYEQMEDKSLYVCDDREFVEAHIEKKGFILVTLNSNQQIIGCFICRFPGMDEDNLGRDIGLGEAGLMKVAHMESTVVDPEYRGHAILTHMLEKAEEMLAGSDYKYYMATVSPQNPASFKSAEKLGYRAVMTKEKYGGALRRIYLKEV